MKVHIDKDALLTALKGALPAVKRSAPLPVLKNVRLSTVGKELVEVAATDLEMSIQIRIPAVVDREGATTLPAHDLLKVLSKLTKQGWLSLEQEGADVSLAYGRTSLTLFALPADDFPGLSIDPNARMAQAALRTGDLLTGLRRTRFAAAKDDKSVISGALLNVTGESMCVVTTDGYRLVTWTGASKMQGQLSAIIPGGALAALERLLARGNDALTTVSLESQRIIFEQAGVLVSVRTIDGQFPPYTQIIPKEFTIQATLPRAELLAAVTRMWIIASEREARTTKLQFQSGEVVLSASSAERGRAEDRLPVHGQLDEASIQFNATYLIEALKSFKGEMVNLSMNSALAPACLTSAEDDGLFHLLMPIRS